MYWIRGSSLDQGIRGVYWISGGLLDQVSLLDETINHAYKCNVVVLVFANNPCLKYPTHPTPARGDDLRQGLFNEWLHIYIYIYIANISRTLNV